MHPAQYDLTPHYWSGLLCMIDRMVLYQAIFATRVHNTTCSNFIAPSVTHSYFRSVGTSPAVHSVAIPTCIRKLHMYPRADNIAGKRDEWAPSQTMTRDVPRIAASYTRNAAGLVGS
jgi:hypothetical protein